MRSHTASLGNLIVQESERRQAISHVSRFPPPRSIPPYSAVREGTSVVLLRNPLLPQNGANPSPCLPALPASCPSFVRAFGKCLLPPLPFPHPPFTSIDVWRLLSSGHPPRLARMCEHSKQHDTPDGLIGSPGLSAFFSAGALGYVNDCPCVIRTQVKIHPLYSCSLSCNPRTSLDFRLRMLIWLDPRAVTPADCDSPDRRIVASRSWDYQNYRNHNTLAVPFFRQKVSVCGYVNEGCGKHNKYIRDSPLVRFLMPLFSFL